jgi:D-3-phosphoglycerate dehydrogenase
MLAISDSYIPCSVMRSGLSSLEALGIKVEVRPWEHDTLVQLQEANLAIEQRGPTAVDLPVQLLQDVDRVDFLVTQFAPISQRFIQATTSLKMICVLRGGTENVDVPYATERGICVMNTPGRNARAVAEATLGMILSEVRNIARAHAQLKSGHWQREYPNREAIPELNGRTVGLVGFGAVAQLVASYLRAFGSRILAYDPFFRGDPGAVTLVDLPTLLSQSDVVSVHARLTEESRHLIGQDELALMQPNAVLVNTARSGLVDEQALVQALSSRQIMGAALDVFQTEPLGPDHPLVQLDNVTLTPHLAGSTIDAFRNSPQLMAGHVRRWLENQGDLPIVNGIVPTIAAADRKRLASSGNITGDNTK